jgi:hypothetical protein
MDFVPLQMFGHQRTQFTRRNTHISLKLKHLKRLHLLIREMVRRLPFRERVRRGAAILAFVSGHDVDTLPLFA